MRLQDIKKQKGLTNKAVAYRLNCSSSKAGMILQGRYIHTYHDEEIDHLAHILGITFERCWFAMCESYNEFMKTPGAEHQRADEVRAEVQAEMQVTMPELGIEVEPPRELAMVESVLVVPEERRLESHTIGEAWMKAVEFIRGIEQLQRMAGTAESELTDASEAIKRMAKE
jgi:transcriptional regulator with XRE-family HTH domain